MDSSTKTFLDILVAIPKIYCLALILFVVIKLFQNTLTAGDFKQFKSWFSKIDIGYLVISFLFVVAENIAENMLDWVIMVLLLILVKTLNTSALRLYHRLPIVMILYVIELFSLLAHFDTPVLLTGTLWVIEIGIIMFSMAFYLLLVIRLHHDRGKLR